jgi:hypothetical protein
MEQTIRRVRCSFCGYEKDTTHICVLYCGPHKVADAYFPAAPMYEVIDRPPRGAGR